MIDFLTFEQKKQLFQFIKKLNRKYEQKIQMKESTIITGQYGQDKITECIKISFKPAEAKIYWIEHEIATDINKFCYKNKIPLKLFPKIERKEYYKNEIEYNLIYTGGIL